MKTIIYSLVLLLVTLSASAVNADSSNQQLKVGDWFECEMEFENGVPVFRNHYFNKDHKSQRKDYISVRFTLQAKTDTANQWNYQVLRFKSLTVDPHAKGSNHENVYCNDTWYPDYLAEDYHKIRDALKGSISFNKEEIVEHRHDYSTAKYFGLAGIFSIRADKPHRGFYTSTFSSSKNVVQKAVEEIASIIFSIKDLKEDKPTRLKWMWIDQVSKPSNKDYKFTIHQNGSNPDHVTNECSAKLLDNGLPYAFTDHHNHRVLAITKASFDIPNKAFIRFIDKRDKQSLKMAQFISLAQIIPQNPAHITNPIPEFIDISKNYTISLKSGELFKLYECTGKSATIFIQPGDTIDITFHNNTKQGISINDNKNNQWYIEHQKSLTPTIIDNAPITEEFKSRLFLELELDKRFHQLEKTENLETDKRLLLDFFFLKSYHYKKLSKTGYYSVLSQYYIQKENQLRSSGTHVHVGFNYSFHEALTLYSSYLQHFKIYDVLKGQYSYTQTRKNKTIYETYLKQCGDTLLRNKVRMLLDAKVAVKPGKQNPLLKLLSVNENMFDLIPSDGKYALVLLKAKGIERITTEQLKDSLPDNIQHADVTLYNSLYKRPSQDSNKRSFADTSFLKVNVHPVQSLELEPLLLSPLNQILILYDDQGKIIYSNIYERRGYDNDYITRYRDEINAAIERNEANTGTVYYSLIAVILGSIIISILLTMLIYRYRMRKMKAKNEQQQLIQKLKLQSVQSQLNPHFLFNALNSIQHLINTENVKDANKYLVGFSGLLRGVLRNSNHQLTPLSDELELIDRYCQLEKLRMNFTYNLSLETATPTDLIEIPNMLLQPLIENGIKHGISKINKPGLIDLKIKEEDSNLYITISDNGPGFSSLSFDDLSQHGKGLKLTNEKLTSIYGDDASFSLENISEGGAINMNIKIG
ncbi:hypothetical protein EYV94_17825 [Puteibacter caeruleilacunae]|nr:hypothetical protein EYV94_17825 [Puteibacter caeruleilacunae]